MKRQFRSAVAALLPVALSCALFGCASSDPAPSETTAEPAVATVCAVGDIRMSDALLESARRSDGSYDFTPLLADATSLIGGADLAIGNLETNFYAEPYGDGSAPEALAEALSAIGFDFLQTANSYTIQNGLSGLERTRSTIEQYGMTALGSYLSREDRAENLVQLREVNGIRIAFIAFTKGMNGMSLPSGAEYCTNLLYRDYNTNYSKVDEDGILEVIQAAQAQSPDVIIAALHWGGENVTEISETQEEIAGLMFRNGVDVILGSHSHQVGVVEQRSILTASGAQKSVVLAYGLGDFCAAAEGETTAALALTLEFTRTGDSTAITGVRYDTLATVDQGADAANRYVVLNAGAAIELYENNYYKRVSETLYESLLEAQSQVAGAVRPERIDAE